MSNHFWLIYFRSGNLAESSRRFDRKEAALSFVGNVVTARIPNTKINRIYLVNEKLSMIEHEVFLNRSLRLDFREKVGG